MRTLYLYFIIELKLWLFFRISITTMCDCVS